MVVVRIFRDEQSCLRLIRALAAEVHEDWMADHRHLNMEALREQMKTPILKVAWKLWPAVQQAMARRSAPPQFAQWPNSR